MGTGGEGWGLVNSCLQHPGAQKNVGCFGTVWLRLCLGSAVETTSGLGRVLLRRG